MRAAVRVAVRLCLAAAAAAAAAAAPGTARGEVCTYAGTTDPTGQVVARAEATTLRDGTTRIDVGLTLSARAGWLWDVQYLGREISDWRDGRLLGVAVNSRTLSNGRVVRQQWDVFTRGPDAPGGGLEARRVQGKTLADFRAKHPNFVRHWDTGAFWANWLPDYAAAGAERRPDLDLSGAALPTGLRTPLAAAFYWVRWLPVGLPSGAPPGTPTGGTRAAAGGYALPVFLPGFKRDMRADLVATPRAAPGDGGQTWRVPLRHPALRGGESSQAEAWVAPDRRVRRIALDVYARQGSGSAVLQLTGCAGPPVPPGGG